MIKRRLLLLIFCCFLITCKSREKPPEQIEEIVLSESREAEETEPPLEEITRESGSGVQIAGQVQRPLPSLAGIGGRVNVQELNPVNYENPDLEILKQMGAEQFLISFLAGEQFYRAGDMDRALSEYTVSINSNSNFIEALVSRGNTWLKKGEHARAINDFTQAIRLDGSRAELYNYRGFARTELAASPRELNAAIEDFSRAIALNGNYVDALINRSHAYYQRGDYDRVIEDCDRIIRLEPQNAFIWNRRGSAWYHKNDDDRAIRDFTEAIRLRDDYAIAWYNRANAWYNKREFDRALSDLTKVLAINPSFTEARRLITQLSDPNLP